MTSTDPGGAAAGMGQGLGGRYPLEGRHVCPFCGAVNETMEGPCPNCTMTNTSETRKATKSRIGPWYVLQSRNPAAPGMRYETLLGFVRKGRVKARSIVRGPTTHQLWRFACQVKGLSREFALCYSCGGSIERDAQLCPQCNRLQDPPADPDVFLESQAAQSSARTDGIGQAAAVPRPVAPAEVWQETRTGPIYKELKLPPLDDDPSLSPDNETAAAVAAPEQAIARSDPGIIASAVAVAPATTASGPAVSQPSVSPPAAVGAAAPAPAASPAPPRAELPRVAPASPPAAPPRGADGPPKRNASDVFLSARDLAAAFQLGFDGDTNGGQAGAGAAAAADAPWGRAGASEPAARAPYRRPRRKRRVGRVILLLLVLALGGAAAYLALNVAARERVFAWAEGKYLELTGGNLYPDLARSRRTAAGPATTPAAAAQDPDDPFLPGASVVPPSPSGTTDVSRAETPTGTGTESPAEAPDDAPARASIGAVPAPVPAAPPATRATTDRAAGTSPDVTASDVGAPDRRPSVATRPAAGRTPPESVRTPQAPATAPSVNARAAPVTQPAPARPSIDDLRRRSRELWDDALKAEEAGDYREAKALYEQMMKLPREVWYQGIEGRLRFAKEMLGEK